MVRIFATSKNTGERFEIPDQYWFEENGVHDWHGQGHWDNFTFEFYQEGNPWKPIDTAPMDGTYILVCAVGRYYNPTVAAWRTTADGVKHWKDYAGNKITATHWMPLPKPPEEMP